MASSPMASASGPSTVVAPQIENLRWWRRADGGGGNSVTVAEETVKTGKSDTIFLTVDSFPRRFSI